MRTALMFIIVFLFVCEFQTASSAPLQQNPPLKISDSNLVKASISGIIKDSFNTTRKDSTIYIVRDTSYNHIDTKLRAAAFRLKQKAAMARDYLTANGLNTDICFMVDMSIPSGKKRFFVYNLSKDSVEFTAMVSHGSGSWKPNCDDQLVFSNLPNSNATSVGRYKIGNSYWGTYGLSYKLFGLDSTNNNAFERAIVLHSDSYVPEKETYPYHIYESAGCPIVSPSFLTVLGKFVNTTKKPMMLWVYN